MATIRLGEKALISTLTENDSLVVVTTDGSVRRITRKSLATLLSALPAVTTSDNGKLLTVVGGVWSAAAHSGDVPGGGSAGQVLAKNSASSYDLKWIDPPSGYTLPIASPTKLGGVAPETKGDAMTQAVGVDANGKLWTAPPGDELPEVDESDNGKALVVSNGEWDVGDVDTLPGVTAEDDGKVMAVVGGSWNKANVASVVGDLVFTYDADTKTLDISPLEAGS